MVLSPAPLIKPDVRFPEYGFPIIFFQGLSLSLGLPVIASTGVIEIFRVNSVAAISFSSLLQKHGEGIAPSLSQGYVVLEIQAVIWANPTPLSTR